ncbi:MAG TPA: metallopeptidase family protein, partial [Polyangiaceae bacterium LLY-WYZ-15_(1-7)]|nr:metallopeptidase family protein [Polyangiaceae bacterium LLY-WYZ-15_(1-7)]
PRTVRLEPAGIEDDRVDGAPLFAGRFWNALAAGALEVAGEDPDMLWLADAELLRDLAERRGAIALAPAPWTCRNCAEPLELDSRDAPLETLLEADPSGDAPPEGPFPLEPPIDGVTAVHMRPVRLGAVRPLWRMLAEEDARIDAAVVGALGLEALEMDGREERRAARIARKLGRASDALLGVVETLFVELNTPARCRFPGVCAECGAIHDVPTPSERAFEIDPAALDAIWGPAGDPAAAPERFPSLEAFAARAEELREEVFRERGVENLELVVDDGVPAVDDGGEPLMGSYQPVYADAGAHYTDVRFVITLYYRTFEDMFASAPYDVDAELRETLDHEVEHHLHHLRGHDPMHEEELRQARRDLERTFGKKTVRAAERKALGRELGEMARFLFFGLLFAGALLAAAIALGLVE